LASSTARSALLDLGLTDVEADVYLYLLQNPGASGYKVSQGTGRLSGNVYQAIDSLASKGAVMIESGTNRRAQPVPVEGLLAVLRERFEQTHAEARTALAGLDSPPPDNRTYRLTSPEQVYAQARTMLGRCERLALLDLFPVALERLTPDIEAATARGVETRLKAYQPATVEVSEMYFNTRPAAILQRYPGTAITISTDAGEILIAWLSASGDEVLEAVWTASPILAFQCYIALSGNLELYAVLSMLASLGSFEELDALLEPVRADIIPFRPDDLAGYFVRHRQSYAQVPGYARLLESLGLAPAER
jgi:sugar-specific transcriptional regulator TrmB